MATGPLSIYVGGSLLPVADARLTGQTSTVASVAAYTVGPADSSFLISGNINCTTYGSGNINFQVAYTDETGASQTPNLQGHFTSGYSTNVSGTGAFEVQPIQIRAQAGSAVTVKTVGTFSATYNVEGTIFLIRAN